MGILVKLGGDMGEGPPGQGEEEIDFCAEAGKAPDVLTDEEKERRKEVRKLIEAAITEILKEHEFKKKSSTWRKVNEENQTIDIFQLQKNRYAFEYYLEAGVFETSQDPKENNPKIEDCGSKKRQRFGDEERVLNLEDDSLDVGERIGRVRELLVENVLPYYDRIHKEIAAGIHTPPTETEIAEAKERRIVSWEVIVEEANAYNNEKQPSEKNLSRAWSLAANTISTSPEPDLAEQSSRARTEFTEVVIMEFDRRGWNLPGDISEVSPNSIDNATEHDIERCNLIKEIAAWAKEKTDLM